MNKTTYIKWILLKKIGFINNNAKQIIKIVSWIINVHVTYTDCLYFKLFIRFTVKLIITIKKNSFSNFN